MAVQDNRGGIQLNVVQPVASGASSRGSLHNLTGSPKNEQSSCGNDYFPKARKPYTITKQRERWTEEEHKKFLEALKLYGRAWRRIEEHIGTKTAVQIRSHAQKFFSKVVRESGDNSTSPTEPIEIPPPRPKRKPMRPYPRKMMHPLTKEPLSLEKPTRSSSPNSYLTEPENQSPTSVLSAVAPDICDSNTPNQSLSPVSPACGFHPVELMLSEPLSSPEYSGSPMADLQTVCSDPSQLLLKENDSSEEGLAKEKSTRCLKLFGRTVLVTECHQPSSQTGENSILLASDTCEKKPTEMLLWDLTQSGKKESTWANLPHVNHGVFYYVPIQKEDNNQVERGSCALLPWGTFPGGVSFPFVPFQEQEHHLDSKCEETPYKGIQKEGSLTGSNSGSINGGENMDNETQSPQFPLEKKELSPALELRYLGRSTLSNGKTSPEKSMRGFVPYKKSKTQRDSYSSTVIGEEREEQKIHLFL